MTENGDQRGQVQCPRKGILRGILRQERGQCEDEDEGKGKGKGKEVIEVTE